MKKTMAKVITWILTLTITVMMFGVVSFAAGESNFSMTIDKSSVKEGDTVTVTVSNRQMTVGVFTGGFAFDKTTFQVIEITTNKDILGRGSIISTLQEANTAGTVGFAWTDPTDYTYDPGVALTAVLQAVKDGSCVLKLYEDSDGPDGIRITADSPQAQKIEIEIEHAHNLLHFPAKAATFEAEGNIEYWQCTKCGKYFSDEAAETEITQADTIIPKLVGADYSGVDAAIASIPEDISNTAKYTAESVAAVNAAQAAVVRGLESSRQSEVDAMAAAITRAVEGLEIRKYTISWYDDDGTTLLKSAEVAYDALPQYGEKAPEKASTAEYTYTFDKWNPAVGPVAEDTKYTASYTAEKNKYTITWKNWDDTVLAADEVEYGIVPAYTGADPEREGDVQYAYTFKGWTPEIQAVTDAAEYKAEFKYGIRQYTVTFKDDLGNIMSEEKYDYGTLAADVVVPNTDKEPDAQYTYTFTGWDKEVADVTGDAVYIANYDKVVNKYTITFINGDGSTLWYQDIDYGTPAADVLSWLERAAGPATKEATAQYTYTFSGWDPEVADVTGEATYRAQFTETVNTYKATWKDWDGNVLAEEDVEYGTVPTYKEQTPAKEATVDKSYTFSGWTPEPAAMTESGAEYTAVYTEAVRSYTVEFVQDNGEPVWTKDFPYGTTAEEIMAALEEAGMSEPAKAPDAQYTYTFSGWTPAVTDITEQTIPDTGAYRYTAAYSSEVNKYEITFLGGDESQTWKHEFDYGTPASEVLSWFGRAGEEPSKAATAQYTYTFSGWDPQVADVTGAATYTAQFTETTNKYNVTFINGDGSVLWTQDIDYGTPAADVLSWLGRAGKEPTKAATAQYSYTFSGWDPQVADVTGEATYTAQFTETVNKYKVTWKNDDGTVLAEEDVEYGTVPSYKGAAPAKAATWETYYVFKGWTPTAAAVTGDAVYTAVYYEVPVIITVEGIEVSAGGQGVDADLTAALGSSVLMDDTALINAFKASNDMNAIGIPEGAAADDSSEILIKLSQKISPQSAVKTDSDVTLTLDIAPQYKAIFGTANLAPYKSGDIKAAGPVNMSVSVGSLFDGQEDINVVHTHEQMNYSYEAALVKSGDLSFVQFTNTNGFSRFVISSKKVAATIGDKEYETVQEAAAEIKDGDTVVIEVLDGDTILSFDRPVSFTVKNNSAYAVTVQTDATKFDLVQSVNPDGSVTYEIKEKAAQDQGGNGAGTNGNASAQDKKTGDNNQIALWIILLILAAGVGTTSVVIVAKRKRATK